MSHVLSVYKQRAQASPWLLSADSQYSDDQLVSEVPVSDVD